MQQTPEHAAHLRKICSLVVAQVGDASLVRTLMVGGATMGANRETCRVLLVEDDQGLREALTDSLTILGHAVHATADGKEALEVMRRIRPDVVVLDLLMPVMDGWQFRLEQRRDPALASTPVVAISASASPAAAAVDADLFVAKPFRIETLARAIDHVRGMRARAAEPSRLAQSERLAALGTLAAGLAHEINNPLTYVILHLDQSLRSVSTLAAGDAEAVVRFERALRSALEGAERIRGITAAIRTFSRGDEADHSALELPRVVEDALRMVEHELRHRAGVVKDFGPVPLVLGNQSRLGQVFVNLLLNAAQALSDDGGRRHTVRIATATADDGRAVVEISDDGHGIERHLLGRIFDPFFSTKPVGQGTGLGLSISYGIVRALGGAIEVDSDAGRGSTFRVLLPPATPRDGRDRRPAPGVASTSARRVLVIDDEPGVCEAIAGELGQEHEVVTAVGGTAGLAVLQQDSAFDVVLCDLEMPGLSGVELHQRLVLEHPGLVGRVVFMTGGAFTPGSRSFLAALGPPMLEKPLDRDLLREVAARGAGALTG